jgi:hypothetical protein
MTSERRLGLLVELALERGVLEQPLAGTAHCEQPTQAFWTATHDRGERQNIAAIVVSSFIV